MEPNPEVLKGGAGGQLPVVLQPNYPKGNIVGCQCKRCTQILVKKKWLIRTLKVWPLPPSSA